MALTHLLPFFFLIFIVQSKLVLYPPDDEVVLLILKDMGIKGLKTQKNHAIFQCPCSLVGIIYKWRMSQSKKACFLRVRNVALKAHKLRFILSPEIGDLLELKELYLPNIESPNIHYQGLAFAILKNQFSGKVPSELSWLICLGVVDLSSNNFAGSQMSLKCFPSLPKFPLFNDFFSGKVRCSKFLNIFWHRELKSPLTNSAMKNSRRYIFIENQITRRYQPPMVAPTSNAQPPLLTTSPQPLKHQNKKFEIEGWIFAVGISVGGLIGLFFSIFLSLIMLRCIKDHKVVIERKGMTTFTLLIQPSELAFLKEDNLASAGHFIGKGGCGEVYRVGLPTNGVEIAIKIVNQPYKNTKDLTEEHTKLLDTKMRQIKQEIKIVGLIRHRNLLPLLAHVPRTNCHYLVYEYMKNGNLEDVIYQLSKGERKLRWLSRHRIALGIAEGLKYIHMDITPRIIHRDLKPANILLDDSMEPKITDFGLSKAFPEINTHLMSNVAGTIGYLAPEYHETLMFSEKSDIYSFGVILATLVMGKLPTDDYFQHTEEMNMVEWMRNVSTSDDPWRAIDPNLIGKGHENVMLFILKLACTCTSDEPNERPSSNDVRNMLALNFPKDA